MSQTPSKDPRFEAAAQSDEAVLRQHSPEAAKAQPWLPKVLVFAFCFLLCFAGIYLDRHAGDFASDIYNEAHRSYAGGASATPKAFDPVAYGKKQYLSQCVTCHQATGLGLPGTYPPLAGSEWVLGNEERLIRVVLHGLQGPVTVAGQTFPGNVQMPAFGKVPNSGYNWRDDQISAVLTYIRQEWGNKAAPVTTEKVAELRTKDARDKPWTEAELSALQ